MNNKFDELAKGMAQSVTRRAALKKFGAGLAAIALATVGLAKKAAANPDWKPCLPGGAPCNSQGECHNHCCSGSGYLDLSYETGKHWFCNY